MNDFQGRMIPPRPIPKRPSVQPGQSPPLPKRSFLLSEPSQSTSAPLPPESEQSPPLTAPSSDSSEDGNDPSVQSSMLTAPSSTQAEDGDDPSIQSATLATPSTDDMDAHSSFAELATVKRVALAPKAALEGKSRPIPYPAIIRRPALPLKVSSERRNRPTPYPAMVGSKKERKWGLLAWVTSLAFQK